MRMTLEIGDWSCLFILVLITARQSIVNISITYSSINYLRHVKVLKSGKLKFVPSLSNAMPLAQLSPAPHPKIRLHSFVGVKRSGDRNTT